jgi:hypothetical protein
MDGTEKMEMGGGVLLCSAHDLQFVICVWKGVVGGAKARATGKPNAPLGRGLYPRISWAFALAAVPDKP